VEYLSTKNAAGIDDDGLPKARPIAFSDSLRFQASHSAKPSMKSSTHQSTLHLSFKIKCCVDRLRPPPNSGSRPYSITSSARARSTGGLRDQLRRKPWPRRSTSWTSITSVAGAILVNAPTLGGWYLLQGQAVAISRTTGIYALLFSGSSRRKGERGEIGVTRIECARTQ
jgi:hypothetical protein